MFFVQGVIGPDAFAATPPRMRPYAGIGVVAFSQPDTAQSLELRMPLYEEPGLSRVAILDSTRLSGNEWVFGPRELMPPLIVSARRGNWIRVYFDDAGREAWIDPLNKGRFQLWEQFLRRHTVHMLPGLQPRCYQLLQQPGGKLLATLNPVQVFKVLKLEEAWSMVLIDQELIGWVRWRDEDGRILVGLDY